MGRGDAGNRERQPGRRPELGRAPDGLRPLPAGRGESRRSADVASYNAAYKRASLLELGEALESLLEPGSSLHAELRARGGRFLHEPAARIDHLNVSRSGPGSSSAISAGVCSAPNRSRNWPRSRALLYAAGSPLVAPLRLVRTLRRLARSGASTPADVRARARARVPGLGRRRGARLSPRRGRGRHPPMFEYEQHKSRYVATSDPAARGSRSSSRRTRSRPSPTCSRRVRHSRIPRGSRWCSPALRRPASVRARPAAGRPAPHRRGRRARADRGRFRGRDPRGVRAGRVARRDTRVPRSRARSSRSSARSATTVTQPPRPSSATRIRRRRRRGRA